MIRPVCSTQLHWYTEEMASDVGSVESEDPEDDFIVGFYKCPNCGRDVVISDVPPSRQSEYPFYSNH